MKKLKYIIIILTILLIILIGIVIGILNKPNKYVDIIIQEDTPQDTLIELEKYTTKEENDNVFFTISDLIQDASVEEETYYYGQEMYKIQTYDKATYYAYGFFVQEEHNKIEDSYLKIKVDYNNHSFIIENLNKEEYQEAKEGKIKDIDTADIQKNNNNQYELKSFSSEEIARRYIKDYMVKAKMMPNKAFDLLDTTYQSKKFKDLEAFKKYVQKNNNKFTNFAMQKYQCEVEEDHLEYTVLDQYDNYYKIVVYKTMDYKILLDDYTIETEEYIKAYNELTEGEKVSTCIAKFIKLINEKDYHLIYQYLDNTFKQNNFNTEQKFEQYMEKNLFEHNTITIQSKEKIEDIYSCKVTTKSGLGLSAEQKKITIIIKLLEGTNFVMSFSIQ